jgi:hypothetical protein
VIWDQAWIWLIWPVILTGALCAGGRCVAILPVNDLPWFAFVILPTAVVALSGLGRRLVP